MFKDFESTKNWIENIKKFGSKLDLSRISMVLEELNNPHLDIKSIHIAGTNGKGSTSKYISNVLIESGYKVGLYTSPYVVKFNERIMINNKDISDEDIIKYVNQIYPIWIRYNESNNVITFFEVLTIIMFLYFRDSSVDFAVIEVGLGGLLDATNVINPIVTAITNISYDHMHVLGNTLESIAENKLGIVKENIPLITSIDQVELYPLFKKMTKSKHAPLTIVDLNQIKNLHISSTTNFIYKDISYNLKMIGLHQAKNASLAIEVINCINQSHQLNISSDTMKKALEATTWPGRFEIFNGQIILDGAHNIGGINALKETVNRIYKDKTVKCIFSMMFDKEHKKAINVLDTLVDEIYFTEFDYVRRADAELLYNESSNPNKHMHHDFKEIFNKLSKNLKENEILLVTGSLYFISEIRKLLTK